MKMYPQAVWAQIRLLANTTSKLWSPKRYLVAGMCLLRGLENASGCRAALLSHGWTWHLYARPRPRFGSYAPILLKQVLLLLVEIMNLLSKCGLLRSVIQRPRISGVLQRLGLGQNMSTSSLISCGQRKTPVLSITKSPVAAWGWEIKLSDPYWARERAAEHAGNFMYNRERQVEHLL